MGSITKAVITAAGHGTRFLPATKATPKEMLPVVDKPAIQYVVEEAAAAGLSDVLLITSRTKRSIEDHFDRAPELEAVLAEKGNEAKLALVRAASDLATVHSVRQHEMLGLGHAVLCAEQHVGHQPFAVLLGDDLIDPRNPLLPRMIDVRRRYGGSVVTLMEVEPAQIKLYGAATVEPTGEDGVFKVTDLVEKPESDPPSNFAVIGRYVLDPAIFEALHSTPPGRGGEIQLTDAIRLLALREADRGGPVHGVVFSGRRYDVGDRADYLRTIVKLACEREDLGPDFRAWLEYFVAKEMRGNGSTPGEKGSREGDAIS
ncbi:MAG TPA: UTP--glucose-1-phosphate uridylyltransferase [Actinomycetes bacterium]|nr:UTP--glucose-1-phosphate uridylyltransferase [Actinomycetes bacterium]